MGNRIRFSNFPALTVAFILLAGCAAVVYKSGLSPDNVGPNPPGSALDASRAGAIANLNDLNKKHEADLGWIEKSYDALAVKSLLKIPPEDYKKYRDYLDSGSVYIIVHPAYYVFFSGPQLITGDDPPVENAVERFLAIQPLSAEMALLQAQERRMRDFLAYAAMRKKLVIVILPRSYKSQADYNYRSWYDEYTRYLNQVAGNSDSVLYLESRSPSRGYLTEEDMAALTKFLGAVAPKRVLLGGGYIGRCLEEFYLDFTDEYGSKNVYLVPEISDTSPAELTDSIARKLLSSSSDIDMVAARNAIRRDTYKIENVIPKIYDLK